MQSFKISIKAARINAGYDLLTGAHLIGVNKNTLIRWEAHPETISMQYALKLAKIYKCPLDMLNFLPNN